MENTYKNSEPVGYYGISNNLAIAFYEPENGEECDFVLVEMGIENPSLTEVNIEYTDEGDAFVRLGAMEIPMDEVIKM